MIFVKTTENLRFGGYTSITWLEDENKRDNKSFIFSLDKRKKYNIKEKHKYNAIYFCKDISFCNGEGYDLYIKDKCASTGYNQVGNGSYDLPNNYILNNGKIFKILSYKVYHVRY